MSDGELIGLKDVTEERILRSLEDGSTDLFAGHMLLIAYYVDYDDQVKYRKDWQAAHPDKAYWAPTWLRLLVGSTSFCRMGWRHDFYVVELWATIELGALTDCGWIVDFLEAPPKDDVVEGWKKELVAHVTALATIGLTNAEKWGLSYDPTRLAYVKNGTTSYELDEPTMHLRSFDLWQAGFK